MSRKESILALLSEDPEDLFLRYSLAMELRKERDYDSALEHFHHLAYGKPPYVAAYFMAAQMLVDIDRVDEGRSYLRDGIEAARGAGDHHAAAEMSEFLTQLGRMGEW
jgi:tetratricopeptide (TPR) repeat protein